MMNHLRIAAFGICFGLTSGGIALGESSVPTSFNALESPMSGNERSNYSTCWDDCNKTYWSCTKCCDQATCMSNCSYQAADYKKYCN